MNRKIILISFLVLVPTILLISCESVTHTPTPDQVGTIVAGTLTAGPGRPTATAETTLTALPAESLETPTAIPSHTPSSTPRDPPSPTPSETSTNTPAPTGGNSPTPAADDPAASLGSPDWKAAFKDDSNWYTFETDQSSIQVVNGALVLTSFKTNNYENWSMSYPKIADFYLEMQGTFGDTCRGKDRFGMIFRAPDPNQGILFGITCDGYFRVRTWDGDSFLELAKWQQSLHIRTGPDQTNRIGVMADGAELSFYINGHLVAELWDDEYDMGVFGAYIASSETPGLMVTITQAAYWELP